MSDENYTAIISVNESGEGSLMAWSKHVKSWQKDDHNDMDMLGEYDFKVPVGVYKATMTGRNCGGNRCNGYPCAGDCFESEWTIGDAIYVLPNFVYNQGFDRVWVDSGMAEAISEVSQDENAIVDGGMPDHIAQHFENIADLVTDEEVLEYMDKHKIFTNTED